MTPRNGTPDLAALGGTTCVVTGGLGFIGSNLTHALHRAGATVRVIDALVPEHGGDPRNLEGLEGIEVHRLDVGDRGVAEVVRDADVVFNLAGQVSHHASMTHPMRDLDLNVRSQLGLLETLRCVNPAARVVLASTRQLYGRPTRLPVDESHPTRPVDVNGIDKLACEQLHLLYTSVHGLRACALRLSNVYGPRQNLVRDDLGAIPVFVRRALRGETISLFGDGRQRRDCLHVDDVVSAFALAATSDAAVGNVYNIGHEHPWPLRQIVDTIVDAVADRGGPRSAVELVAWPVELAKIDIGDFDTDSRKAMRELAWRPLVDLDAGCADTIAFYLEHPWYLSST
jgi:nucleoside-diphosphate-sugar epimerase